MREITCSVVLMIEGWTWFDEMQKTFLINEYLYTRNIAHSLKFTEMHVMWLEHPIVCQLHIPRVHILIQPDHIMYHLLDARGLFITCPIAIDRLTFDVCLFWPPRPHPYAHLWTMVTHSTMDVLWMMCACDDPWLRLVDESMDAWLSSCCDLFTT